jgi:hypothetical protein
MAILSLDSLVELVLDDLRNSSAALPLNVGVLLISIAISITLTL